MKNWMVLLSVLTCYTALEGLSFQENRPSVPDVRPEHFPLSPNQKAFTEVSYLLWKPRLRDLDFAVKTASIPGDVDQPAIFKSKLEKPNFDWDSGVRVGLGVYLPDHDAWDISAFATYFYGEASKKTHANFEHNESLAPDFVQDNLVIPSNKSSAAWQLNFFTWDLSVGRLFNLPRSITVHPYAGLRGALIDQDYLVRTFGQILPTPSSFIGVTDKGRFKATSEFWGIGPRVGANFIFEFGKHWSLLGNFAASVLYGHYDVKEKQNNQDIELFISMPNFTSTFLSNLKAKDHGYVIRPNLEGSFGFGWEKWVQNNRVRIAPSIALESSIWFAMNQFFDFVVDQFTNIVIEQPIPIVTSVPEFETIRRHGNLVFVGFTFNFQVDF